MKRFKFFLTFIVIVVGIYFVVAIIHSCLTEWYLYPKTYNEKISLTTSAQSLAEIDEEVRKKALKEYPGSYLGRISVTNANYSKSIKSFEKGEVEFTYYKNLVNFNIYNFDCFAITTVRVDLKKKEVTQIDIYGNDQLGGWDKLESYPEMNEIHDVIYSYCKDIENIESDFYFSHWYLSFDHSDKLSVNVRINLSDGTERKLKGTIKKYDEYCFFADS